MDNKQANRQTDKQSFKKVTQKEENDHYANYDHIVLKLSEVK